MTGGGLTEYETLMLGTLFTLLIVESVRLILEIT